MADALSRDPFAKLVSHRLISENYGSLLAEADAIGEDGNRDVFRLKVQSHIVKKLVGKISGNQSDSCPLTCVSAVVKAICEVYK